MERFPKTFEEILTPQGLAVLDGKPLKLRQFNGKSKLPPFARFPGFIRPEAAQQMYDLIDKNFARYFLANKKSVQSFAETAQQYKNSKAKRYEDKTGTDFSIRFKVIYYINRQADAAYKQAVKFGLFDLQRSESYLRFCQNVTGLKLTAIPETCQLNLYQHGDHIGMHTDYWANKRKQPVQFIGMHIGMCNPDVSSMALMYEEKGYMTGIMQTVSMGSLALFRFPFWHCTTPLQAFPGKEKTAKKYLFLSALAIDGQPEMPVSQLQYL